jgi:hypothetical protein
MIWLSERVNHSEAECFRIWGAIADTDVPLGCGRLIQTSSGKDGGLTRGWPLDSAFGFRTRLSD